VARTLSSVAAILALAACAHGTSATIAPPPSTQLVADADGALAAAVRDGDAGAFRARVAPDAVFAGGAVHVGRDQVWAGWSRYFEKDGPVLRWAPSAAGIAGSGDLGWTTGSFIYESAPGPDGKRAVADGRYLSVWSRQADGTWVAALDMGLVPPTGAEGERTTLRTLVSRDGAMEAAMGTWAGPGSPVSGAWMVVRERGPAGWKVVQESALKLPPR
jgi:ketosteroid isomerase-like protein